MKSIKEDTITEIVINKSRFIGIACNINSKNDVISKINYYKKKYKDATHYCYAYIIKGYQKCDDDKEPSGTAGLPILNVLKNVFLDNTLCIVIRYFGGIKLGAGGLVRAYSKTASKVIQKSSIVSLIDGYKVTITFPYENTKIIDNLLKNKNIKKEHNENIKYEFKTSKENFAKIETILNKYTTIQKKESIQITV